MANLRSLKPSLTNLTKQEQLDLHESIRVSRQVSKTQKIKKIRKTNTSLNSVNKLVSKITPEQARDLLEKLKKEGRI